MKKESEAGFLQTVRELAKLYAWATYHTHDSRRSEAGFPDLVLVRERVIYAELEIPPNKVKPGSDQDAWIKRLRAARQEVYVWEPSMWAEIEKVLQ